MNTVASLAPSNVDVGHVVDGQVITVIQAKILYTLGIYRRLSRSMLQTGIGPAISPAIWTPVLEDMITRRLVQEFTVNVKGTSGRANSPKVIMLTPDGLAQLPEDVKEVEQTLRELEQNHSQGRPG